MGIVNVADEDQVRAAGPGSLYTGHARGNPPAGSASMGTSQDASEEAMTRLSEGKGASTAMDELCEVVITAPDSNWLVEFSRQLVRDGLCSNGHNFAAVRSIYRWRGQVHDKHEGRVSLHTRKSRVAEIVQRAKEEHAYEVPSISTRPIEDGNPEYLRWILNETDPEHASH